MDYCENCGTELTIEDFYQDVPQGKIFYQTWHYKCPKCGKKYFYTEYWYLEHIERGEE